MSTSGPSGGMHNLSTLIKRLEAATSRLEDIATSIDDSAQQNHVQEAVRDNTKTAAATESMSQVSSVPSAAAAQAPAEPLPRSIERFDEILANEVEAFVNAAQRVGGLVDEQAQHVQKAFQALRTFLLITTRAKKPDTMSPELFVDLQHGMSGADGIKETNRRSPLFLQLSMVAEGIIGLGWVGDPRPGDFVDSAIGGAQYNGNKVLKEFKDRDQNHVQYVQTFYKSLQALKGFVTEFYKTGLTWNQKDGIDAMEALSSVQSGTATPRASAVAAPPPPPGPPPPAFVGDEPSKGGDMSGVFSDLNRGSAVTSGLRKVDKSEMTHKNPSLRAGPQRQASGSDRSKSPLPARKPDSLRSQTQKPPRKELEGNKWIIENHENTQTEPITIQGQTNQSIQISRCNKAVIIVKNKVNAISIDNCTNLSLIVDSLVSSIDVIKASKFAIQIDGVLPTILLDQVDGAQIYLQEATMRSPPEVLTSKCSGVNIVTPPRNEREDSKETAVPEQLRSYFKEGRLVTEIVEHAG